jgi:hypothetical protein
MSSANGAPQTEADQRALSLIARGQAGVGRPPVQNDDKRPWVVLVPGDYGLALISLREFARGFPIESGVFHLRKNIAC